MKNRKTLTTFVDSLQAQGKYWFTKQEFLSIAGNSNLVAFAQASHRLAKENRIALITRGFYVIIPIEYKNSKILPTSWYVDPLMQYLNLDYYVGLLIAASFYGAAHQQPQIFQVCIAKQLRTKNSKSNISFFTKKDLLYTPKKKHKVETGYINISTKEATALDLVQYHNLCGYWNNVGTILMELSNSLDPQLLLDTAINGKYELPIIQRLGSLLDLVGGSTKTVLLHKYIQTQKPRNVYLTAQNKNPHVFLNKKWRVWVNEEVDLDL